MPTLDPYVIPTGGVIGIRMVTAVSGQVLLSRATSGASGLSAFTPIYSGAPLSANKDTCFFLDNGEQLPGNVLPSSAFYVYKLDDADGSTTSEPLTPVASFNILRVDFTNILISLLQGAINAVQLPEGIGKCRVLQAMPITGLAPMPFIVVNPDLIQQAAVPIGQSVVGPGMDLSQPNSSNIIVQTEFANNVFRVSTFAINADERNFYRDFIISIFRANLGYVFQAAGADVTHKYQASSYQVTEGQLGMAPGFYAADIMVEFEGNANISITTQYGLISTINTATSAALDGSGLFLTINTAVTGAASGTPVLIETTVPLNC